MTWLVLLLKQRDVIAKHSVIVMNNWELRLLSWLLYYCKNIHLNYNMSNHGKRDKSF